MNISHNKSNKFIQAQIFL